MKKVLFFFLVILSIAFSGTVNAQCNALYVTPTATPTGDGTKANPMSISNAFGSASSGTTIKLGIGTYTIDNPLTLANSGVVVEGGFNPTNNWTKTSQAGATTIFRSALNPEGSANQQRLVAIYIDSKTNFRFQDLTVSTANGLNAGTTTYCVHMNNCSNYSFVRSQMLPGNGAAGTNGAAGANGSIGSSGVNGLPGEIDTQDNPGHGGNGGAGAGTGAGTGGTGGIDGGGCCAAGIAGTAGSASSNYRAGGGGGGGGCGGEEQNNGGAGGNGGGVNGGAAQTPGGAGGSWGDPGNPGVNGATGLAGTNGASGAAGTAATFSTFFIPGSQGAAGQDGQGGKGGTGGGGGGGQYCTFCVDGAGNGGGGGGGGGQGATGGTGGYGGGGSFGIYIVSNGAGGSIIDSRIVPGTAGSGGTGGSGGIGGNGGTGGTGAATGTGEIGRGGNGGAGGKGGNGGNGGSGQPGSSSNVQIVSGSPLLININNTNLPAQQVIQASEVFCTAEQVTFSAAASGGWDFGIGSSPITATGASVNTFYTSTGSKNITYNSVTYTSFITLTCTSPVVPTITGPTEMLCEGSDVTLSIGSGSLNSSTSWEWYEGSCAGTPVGSGTSITVAPAAGTTNYFVRAEGGCPTPSLCANLAVTIGDMIAPVADVALLADITDQCAVSVLTAPSATDNCSASVIVTSDAILPITAQGTTVVTWTYDDGNGNTSTQTQNVIILDDIAPIPDVAALPNVVAECSVDQLIAPTATDNCSSAVTVSHDAALPIITQGTTVINWTFDDGNGNTTVQSQNIVIEDVSAPVPDQATLADITALCEVSSLTDPSATDNCSGDVTVSNDATLPITSSGVVTWTYTDQYGNSSTQTQNVTIEPVDASVTLNVATITATNQNAGVTYQWVNCDNGNAPINGATSASYTPTVTGNYAVIVTEDGCSETSECILVDFTTIEELEEAQITVYPNPTTGLLNILSNSVLDTELTVLDMNGRIIKTDTFKGTLKTLDLSGTETGIYLVRIQEQTFRIILK